MVKKYKVTNTGFEQLKKELNQLEQVKRPQAVSRLTQARDMGDLSENSEYVAAKESLAFIDEQIFQIKSDLENAEIVTATPDKDAIEISDSVTVVYNGDTFIYNIVGELEADITQNKISNTSPIGKALIGKSVGDVVTVVTPSGKVDYKIIDIK